MREQLERERRQRDVLKRFFMEEAAAFRRTARALFGYDIKVHAEGGTSAAARRRYRVHPALRGVADESREIVVVTEKDDVQIAESPFVTQYADEFDRCVGRYNSLPLFFANVTVKMFSEK